MKKQIDRAAPNGTGHIKAGLNYAMSLHAIMDAHRQGFLIYAENVRWNIYIKKHGKIKYEAGKSANL